MKRTKETKKRTTGTPKPARGAQNISNVAAAPVAGTWKRSGLLIALFVVALTICYAVLFPETLRQMEYTDNFSFTSDFFNLKISEAPGLTAWLGNFLLQFFRWPAAGAFIEALLVGMAALGCAMIPVAMKRQAYTEASILVAVGLVWFYPHYVNYELAAMFFFWAVAGFFAIKNKTWRSAYVIAFTIVGFFLTTWTLLFLFLLICALGEWFWFKTKWYAAVPVVGMGLAVAEVYVSSNVLGFIPFNKRFFSAPEFNVSRLANLALYLVPLLLLLPKRKEAKGFTAWLPSLASVLLVGITFYVSFRQTTKTFSELCFHYSNLADQHRWQQLLNEIPREDLMNSKVKRAYALMAESELGRLPDNLSLYPVYTTEDFLYSHERKQFGSNFNRQFYANIGLWNEAYHMAFEYNVMSYDGQCMGAMRDMVRYLIKMGDYKVADKVLKRLSRTSFNGSFVRTMREEMKKPAGENINKLPLRADDFIACYPFNSEMVRLLQLDPTNKKLLDYLLCGLLIDHRVGEFSVILKGFPLYKGKPLPKAYAEAAAMLEVQHQSVRPDFDYNPAYDQNFHDFYALSNRRQLTPDEQYRLNGYRNTYWYTFFFTQSQDVNPNAINHQQGN